MAAVYRDRGCRCEKMIRYGAPPRFTAAPAHASTAARAAAAVTAAPTPACRRPPPRLDEGQNMRAYADTAAP